MNTSNSCKVKFDTGDFLSEEQLLRRKHREGNAFCRWQFGNRLSFTTCPPEEYTYRLDYPESQQNREEWLTRLSSRGWEHCGKLHSWDCFRKAGQTAFAEELTDGLFHTDAARAKRGRARAERNMVLGVLPMAVFYFAGLLFRDTAYANALWQLAALFLVVAVVLVLPALHVRGKCGAILLEEQKAASGEKTDSDHSISVQTTDMP